MDTIDEVLQEINWYFLGIIGCIWVSYSKTLIPLYTHGIHIYNYQPFLFTKRQIGKLTLFIYFFMTLKINIIDFLLGYQQFSINLPALRTSVNASYGYHKKLLTSHFISMYVCLNNNLGLNFPHIYGWPSETTQNQIFLFMLINKGLFQGSLVNNSEVLDLTT